MKNNTPTENTAPQESSLADIYGFLALTMRYPDSALHNDDFFEAFENLLDALKLEDERYAIQAWRSRDTQPIDTLQIEYTRLFINAVPHLIAPPYGSFYLDGDRNLQGKSTERTRDFYREHGYDITDASEPGDHIRIELEFLAALVRENQMEAEDEFLHTIFRPWFGQFCAKVQEDNAHLFYTAAVKVIELFTTDD